MVKAQQAAAAQSSMPVAAISSWLRGFVAISSQLRQAVNSESCIVFCVVAALLLTVNRKLKTEN